MWRRVFGYGRGSLAQGLAVWVAAFLVLMPLVSLGAMALRGGDGVWPHLLRYVLPSAFWDTLLLLAGIGLCTGIIGVATAWLVTAYRFPGRAVIGVLLVLPLTMPTYITAYVYADLLDAFGPVQRGFRTLFGLQLRSQYWFPEIRSLGGAIFVMTFVLYPYVYLSARAVFALQSGSMLDAARSLGSSASGIVRHVVVPLARPALAIGLSLVLLEALNDIGASDYFGVRTLTVTIANTWLSKGSLAGAAQIACLLLALVFALVFLEARGRSTRTFALSSRRPCPVRAQPVSRRAGLLIAGFCLLPALLGFVVPFVSLGFEAWSKFMLRGLSPDLWQALWNSVVYALLASLATVLLGFVLASALRTDRRPQTRLLVRVAAIGYAVPGTVLAIGLLMPVAMLDRSAAAIMAGLGRSATALLSCWPCRSGS
jgi:iron(III) transport system permease protein